MQTESLVRDGDWIIYQYPGKRGKGSHRIPQSAHGFKEAWEEGTFAEVFGFLGREGR